MKLKTFLEKMDSGEEIEVLHENLGDEFRTDGNDRYRMSVKK